MIVRARGKGAWGVTDAAVLCGRHVVARLAAGGDPMAGRAVVHDAGMIRKRARKTVGVMTGSTVGVGRRVVRHGG